MTDCLILETYLYLQWYEELLVFPLRYQVAFFNLHFLHLNFKVVTSCHVASSTVCRLRFIWALIRFVTCVVIFSAISANSFSSASCFCVSVFLAFMTYLGTVLVHVYSGYWWLSGDNYGCSCMSKVRSTTLVLECHDLMKLASIAFSMNGHASFRFFF